MLSELSCGRFGAGRAPVTAAEATRRDRRGPNMLAVVVEVNRRGEVAISGFEGHYSHMRSHSYIEQQALLEIFRAS